MGQDNNADVIVIGAGISGLMAAQRLEDAGMRVLVLERDAHVGGRMQTVDMGAGRGDTGAQFFTVHLPEFQTWVERWIDEGIVYVWSRGFSDGSLLLLPSLNNYPHYAVHHGMRALPEHLAGGLRDVRVSTEVVTATYDDQGWILQDYDGALYSCNVLLFALPVPLALRLLGEGATDLTELDFDSLSAISYSPCLTGLFHVEGLVTLPEPGAVQRHNSNIIWVGNNRQKGISPADTILTVQASGQHSVQLRDSSDDHVLRSMYAFMHPFLSDSARVIESQIIRWKFARPITTHKARCLVAAGGIPAVFAGDAFQGPRVEGAALSGVAAAEAILKMR